MISSSPLLQLPIYADNLLNWFLQPKILFQIWDLYIPFYICKWMPQGLFKFKMPIRECMIFKPTLLWPYYKLGLSSFDPNLSKWHHHPPQLQCQHCRQTLMWPNPFLWYSHLSVIPSLYGQDLWCSSNQQNMTKVMEIIPMAMLHHVRLHLASELTIKTLFAVLMKEVAMLERPIWQETMGNL